MENSGSRSGRIRALALTEEERPGYLASEGKWQLLHYRFTVVKHSYPNA
jgi:hypothetical protein